MKMKYLGLWCYGDYNVDYFMTSKCYEGWIYHKDCGVKQLMFGCPIEQQTFEQFQELIEANIDEYIPIYDNLFLDAIDNGMEI